MLQQHGSTLPSAGQKKPIRPLQEDVFFFPCIFLWATVLALRHSPTHLLFTRYEPTTVFLVSCPPPSPTTTTRPNLIGGWCARRGWAPSCRSGCHCRHNAWKDSASGGGNGRRGRRGSTAGRVGPGTARGGQVDPEDAYVVSVLVLSPSFIHILLHRCVSCVENEPEFVRLGVNHRVSACGPCFLIAVKCGWVCLIFYFFFLSVFSRSNKMGRRQSQRKPPQPHCALPRQDNKHEKVRNRRDDWSK